MSDIKAVISRIQHFDQALTILYSAADEFVRFIENSRNPFLSIEAKISIEKLKVLLVNWFQVEADIDFLKVSADELRAQIVSAEVVVHSLCSSDDRSGGSYKNFRVALSNASLLLNSNIAEDYSVAIELFNVIVNRSDIFRKLDGGVLQLTIE